MKASAKTPAKTPARADLQSLPGHGIRRLHQIAVSVFMQQTADDAITPVQYAVLHTLADNPGVDQRTLARLVSFDTSTIGGVIDRLEARGALTRSHSEGDRRVRLLHLTADGESTLASSAAAMHEAQARMLDPLSASERKEFMRMIQKVIAHHEE